MIHIAVASGFIAGSAAVVCATASRRRSHGRSTATTTWYEPSTSASRPSYSPAGAKLHQARSTSAWRQSSCELSSRTSSATRHVTRRSDAARGYQYRGNLASATRHVTWRSRLTRWTRRCRRESLKWRTPSQRSRTTSERYVSVWRTVAPYLCRLIFAAMLWVI